MIFSLVSCSHDLGIYRGRFSSWDRVEYGVHSGQGAESRDWKAEIRDKTAKIGIYSVFITVASS